MKSTKKIGSLMLALLITLVMTTPIISVAAEAPINLGTAKDYAILAGQTITNTGTTTINGNVGLSPGTAFTQGPAIINGEIHINDAAANQAKIDLLAAYVDAAGRTLQQPIVAELGGQTLTPGYYVNSSSLNLTGILTLDAGNDPNAIFVIQAGSSLITATSSNVVLVNGATSSQIFWVVGSSATLGTSSHLEGTILALTSISLTTGATINGSLLARNGSVTLDSNTVGTLSGTPLIAINKTANRTEIYGNPELVTYSYSVSNPGTTNLEEVKVTDDKIAIINYQSGDTNANSILEPTEVWIYTASAMINITTTNVGQVSALSNNATVVATDAHTVTLVIEAETTSEPSTYEGIVYTAEPTTDATTETTTETSTETTTQQSLEVPGLADTTLETTVETTVETTDETTETVTDIESPPTSPVEPGGSLPQTATPLMLYISSGAALILLGVVGLKFNK